MHGPTVSAQDKMDKNSQSAARDLENQLARIQHLKRKPLASSKKEGVEAPPVHGLSAAQLRSISQVAKLNKLKLEVSGGKGGRKRASGSPAHEYQVQERLRSPD